MATNVFELFATLSLDSSNYTQGLAAAAGGAEDIAAAAGGMGTVVANAAVKAGKAIWDFGSESIQTGAQFDKAMSQVAATMGYSLEDMNDETTEAYQVFQTLRAFAMEQGATTQFTSAQAAEALNYMALAGYDAEKSMRMMPTVLALAAAGNIELAEASDMVTDAASAFGLTEPQTIDMIDQMAKASSRTNTSVAQLGAAFLTIGATARQLKGGTAEAAQVMGLLADNGIKGSEAGTALRNMMMKLQNPTKDGAAALESLGVAIFDSEGNLRDMESIFLDLQAAMDGMTDQERSDILGDLFNWYDLAAANALLGTNADRWAEVRDEIDNADGAAQNMADVQMDNLDGQLKLFNSAFDNLKIMLSDELTPGITNIVKAATDFVTYLTTEMSEGGKLKGAVDFIGTTVGTVADGIVAVIDNIKKAIDWVDKLLGKQEQSSQYAYENRSNDEGFTGPSGSFANGISYVPRDNFSAYLHEGERVLTKDENRAYTSGSGGAETVCISIPVMLDGRQIGEAAYQYNSRKARAFG